MDEHTPYLTIKLDHKDPIDLEDFVGFFGAISSQFDRFMRAEHPDLAPEAHFFVKEVREGSVIADLFPGGFSDIVATMENVVILVSFADLVGRAVLHYAKGGRDESKSKSELKDVLDTVNILAKDSSGEATVETVTYEESARKRKVAFTFTTQQAQTAAQGISEHLEHMEKIDNADLEKQLLYFRRTDSGDAPIGKRSGERAVIESISERDLPVVYVSNLAEQRIKDEIRHSVIYERGFLVDVNVQTKGGRPAAYVVKNVHEVIDLPSED